MYEPDSQQFTTEWSAVRAVRRTQYKTYAEAEAKKMTCDPRPRPELTLLVQSAQRLLALCLDILRMASSGLSAVLRRDDAVARSRVEEPEVPGLASIVAVAVCFLDLLRFCVFQCEGLAWVSQYRIRGHGSPQLV